MENRHIILKWFSSNRHFKYVFLGISVLTGFKAGDGEWWVGENDDVMY